MMVKSARRCLLAEPPQQAVRRRVKRPTVDAAADAPDQALGAREHFLRRAPSEGEEEYPLRPHAAFEQDADAVHEGARLAGPRACDDQQRALAMRGRAALRLVEAGGRTVGGVARCDLARARRVYTRVVGHGP